MYKPILVEIEFTHHCNILCGGCAIREDIKKNKYTLSGKKIIGFLYEAKREGLTYYSLTGGEPFAEFGIMKEVIRKAPLDLLKINTNGFAFPTPNKTAVIFEELKKAGFASKKTKPWIHISIGQQNVAGVPIENSVFACMEFHKVFPENKAGLSFIAFSFDEQYAAHKIKELMTKYQEMTGLSYPSEKFPISIISSDIRLCSTAVKLGITSPKQTTIKELIGEYDKKNLVLNCSPKKILQEDGFVGPRLLLRADGTIYTCPGFTHVFALGNIYQQSLKEILTAANKNIALQTVFKKGLKGLLSLAEKKEKGIGEKKASVSYGPCDICMILKNVVN